MTGSPPRILFVCLGNICRSPMAEGVARKRFAEAGIEVVVDSAGTGHWHVGKPPDRRAVNAAWKLLIDLSGLRARQVEADDFDRFDHIVAMDAENVEALTALAPAGQAGKISRLLDHAETGSGEVPDPYYGGHEGFDEVLRLIDRGIQGLIGKIGNSG